MIRLLNFTTLEPAQKELVLTWRNHPDIRRWMINEDVITLKNHLHFIDLLGSKTDRCYFLVQKEADYIGVIDLTDISEGSAQLGIYANPEMRGMGSILMNALIDQAKTLGISKLIANVYITNVRALNLYKKFDFKETKQREHHHRKMTTLELAL